MPREKPNDRLKSAPGEGVCDAALNIVGTNLLLPIDVEADVSLVGRQRLHGVELLIQTVGSMHRSMIVLPSNRVIASNHLGPSRCWPSPRSGAGRSGRSSAGSATVGDSKTLAWPFPARGSSMDAQGPRQPSGGTRRPPEWGDPPFNAGTGSRR